MSSKFLKKEAIRYGWQTVKKDIGFFAGLLLLVMAIYAALNFLTQITLAKMPLLSVVLSLTVVVANVVLNLGLIKVALKVTVDQKPSVGDLFSCFNLFFRYIWGSILYGLIVCAGFLLLLVPGIIWAVKYQFFPYFMVDQNLKARESLKKSGAITQGAKWSLFLFGFCLVGINLLGVLAMGGGLFLSIPTSMLAMAYVYRKLVAVST